jgi:hypothetical protein
VVPEIMARPRRIRVDNFLPRSHIYLTSYAILLHPLRKI